VAPHLIGENSQQSCPTAKPAEAKIFSADRPESVGAWSSGRLGTALPLSHTGPRKRPKDLAPVLNREAQESLSPLTSWGWQWDTCNELEAVMNTG
jgi:hypothetical protein